MTSIDKKLFSESDFASFANLLLEQQKLTRSLVEDLIRDFGNIKEQGENFSSSLNRIFTIEKDIKELEDERKMCLARRDAFIDKINYKLDELTSRYNSIQSSIDNKYHELWRDFRDQLDKSRQSIENVETTKIKEMNDKIDNLNRCLDLVKKDIKDLLITSTKYGVYAAIGIWIALLIGKKIIEHIFKF